MEMQRLAKEKEALDEKKRLDAEAAEAEQRRVEEKKLKQAEAKRAQDEKERRELEARIEEERRKLGSEEKGNIEGEALAIATINAIDAARSARTEIESTIQTMHEQLALSIEDAKYKASNKKSVTPLTEKDDEGGKEEENENGNDEKNASTKPEMAKESREVASDETDEEDTGESAQVNKAFDGTVAKKVDSEKRVGANASTIPPTKSCNVEAIAIQRVVRGRLGRKHAHEKRLEQLSALRKGGDASVASKRRMLQSQSFFL
eukprot:g4613.t1